MVEKTLNDAYKGARGVLAAGGVEDAEFDARVLVELVTGKDPRVSPDAPVSDAEAGALDKMIRLRAARYPLQYLCGTWDFMDFTLCVGKGVLIPRADTEIVAQTAIDYLAAANSDNSSISALDLCSGTGAIAIALARAVPAASVYAAELSDDAYTYLEKNIAALAPRIHAIKADVLHLQDALRAESFDIIVSNPPYVTPDEMNALSPELAYEPRMALCDEHDGLSFYRHIAAAYLPKLKHGGRMVFEIGSTQADAVCQTLYTCGYGSIEVIEDYASNPRCVTAQRV